MFGHMKDPVAGTATVASYEAFGTPGLSGDQRPGFEVTLDAQVVVQAEGLEPTAVHFVTNFPQSALPLFAGSVLPVVVDRKNPKRLKLAPEFATQAKQAAEESERATKQASRDQAEALAESMREDAQRNAP